MAGQDIRHPTHRGGARLLPVQTQYHSSPDQPPHGAEPHRPPGGSGRRGAFHSEALWHGKPGPEGSGGDGK